MLTPGGNLTGIMLYYIINISSSFYSWRWLLTFEVCFWKQLRTSNKVLLYYLIGPNKMCVSACLTALRTYDMRKYELCYVLRYEQLWLEVWVGIDLISIAHTLPWIIIGTYLFALEISQKKSSYAYFPWLGTKPWKPQNFYAPWKFGALQ